MKVKALIYCCKNGKKLVKGLNGYYLDSHSDKYYWKHKNTSPMGLNGKIVCECEVETEHLFNSYYVYKNDKYGPHCFDTETLCEKELVKSSCVSNEEMQDYFKLNNGYALHLSNVKERVMELSKCHTKKIVRDKVLGSPYFDTDSVDYHYEKREVLVPITKAPQNMMWVWVYENGDWVKYLIISIQPQWVCKILNGEKDIEVRRKVLKGMVE